MRVDVEHLSNEQRNSLPGRKRRGSSETQEETKPGSPDRLKLLLELNGLNTDLIDQWVSSVERTWYIGRRPLILKWSAGGVVLILIAVWVASITLDETTWTTARVWGTVALVVGLVTLGWSAVPYWAARRAFTSRRRASARYSVDRALVKLREAMMDEEAGSRAQLALMFELNRKQLDEYQQITKSQQRTAFALTWGAAVAALLILVIGSVIALRVGDTDKYITGGLTALGALLSAFLGKVFFQGHEQAVQQLNHYYLEPSLTGRLLAAERIMDSLPAEQKYEMASKMMTRILAPEPLPAARKGDKESKEEAKPESKDG